MNRTKLIPLVAALTGVLTACGGGGGGGDTNAAAPAPSAVTAPSSLVTQVPQASYAAGSEELAAYNAVNTERERCGFGKLAQQAPIDAAARDHSLWRLTNNVVGHFQDPVAYPNGYTGRTPTDRLAHRGYADARVTEATAARLPVAKAGMGKLLAMNLLSAPYHAMALLDGYRDVGVAVVSDLDAGSTAVTGAYVSVQFNLASKVAAGFQQLAGDAVATYPCEGTPDVPYALVGESPNPVPGRDLSAQPVGHPLIIKVRDGQVLAVQSVQLVNAATQASVALRPVVTQANDANKQIVTPSVAFVLPESPLAPSTTYRATVSGTNNGVPFSRSFSFTTAAML